MKKFLFAFSLMLMCVSFEAWAWDTKEYHPKGKFEKDKWQSIYVCVFGNIRCKDNEHELVSDRALRAAAQNSPWIIGQETGFRGYDLNTALFKPDLEGLGDSTFIGPQAGMKIETRLLPPVPHFAGLPDFSYTLYDWANKNRFCPSLPENHPDTARCHVFEEWHGARLNSSHFGTQASESYERFHAIAISQAKRAKAMHEAFLEEGEDTVEAHKDFIREAEYLALAYEAAGHHFLSDRWAIGHMFDRWGAPEYVKGTYDDPEVAKVAGMITGIIHGHESVSEIPEALSSPEFDGSTLTVPQWKFPGTEPTYGGVGDYRFEDMKDRLFGKEYKWNNLSKIFWENYVDVPINVDVQLEWMTQCLTSGYGEVMKNFHQSDRTYGVDKVKLTAAGEKPFDEKCLTPRATNEAMAMGWGAEGRIVADQGTQSWWSSMARSALTGGLSRVGEAVVNFKLPLTAAQRTSLVRIDEKIRRRAVMNPEGTDLADGGLGLLGSVPTSDTYKIASYFEPKNLKDLPETDARGRDRESLFGVFNRAGVGYMCTRSDEFITKYRFSEEQKERDVCYVLAQRLYRSTDKDYEGPQKETQTVDFQNNQTEVKSVCELSGSEFGEYDDSPRESSPIYIEPGYVPWKESGTQDYGKSPYSEDFIGNFNQSIVNWCDGVPIIDLLEDKDKMSEDVVAEIANSEEKIRIFGRNFGGSEGTIFIGTSRGSAVQLLSDDISVWRDTELQFSVKNQEAAIDFESIEDKNGNTFKQSFIFVERSKVAEKLGGKPKSVGRFALRIEDNAPKIAMMKITQGKEVRVDFSRQEETKSTAEGEDAGSDAGPVFSDTYSVYKALQPERTRVELEFDRPLNRSTETHVMHIGPHKVEGKFSSKTKWEGEFTIQDGPSFVDDRGDNLVHIVGELEDETPFVIPDKGQLSDAPQKIYAHLGLPALFVEEVSVKRGRRTIYKGEWVDQPKARNDKTAKDSAVTDAFDTTNPPEKRTLKVTKHAKLKRKGNGTIRVRLNVPVKRAPDVTLSGIRIELTGEKDIWEGPIDFSTLPEEDLHQITIKASNPFSSDVDSIPETVAQLDKPPSMAGAFWRECCDDNFHYLSSQDEIKPKSLEGIWETNDNYCTRHGERSTIRIEVSGNAVTAWADEGRDACNINGDKDVVPVWQGTLRANRLDTTAMLFTREDGRVTDRYSLRTTVNVTSPDSFVRTVHTTIGRRATSPVLNYKRVE